jgi:hypothetical protein
MRHTTDLPLYIVPSSRQAAQAAAVGVGQESEKRGPPGGPGTGKRKVGVGFQVNVQYNFHPCPRKIASG